MSDLPLSDELAEKIRDLAQEENRSIDDLVESMLERYMESTSQVKEDPSVPKQNPLIGLIGLLDEFTDETDLSSTVRETLKKYTHPQYGWTKRDRTD